MSEEPFYIRQNAEELSHEAARDWFADAAIEAQTEGATFVRASIHPDHPHLRLMEGWRTAPREQGEPRWSFAAPESDDRP